MYVREFILVKKRLHYIRTKESNQQFNSSSCIQNKYHITSSSI